MVVWMVYVGSMVGLCSISYVCYMIESDESIIVLKQLSLLVGLLFSLGIILRDVVYRCDSQCQCSDLLGCYAFLLAESLGQDACHSLLLRSEFLA